MKRVSFLSLVFIETGCAALTPYAEIRQLLPHEELLRMNQQWVHMERAGTGEPVLLLHGFGGSTYCWREVMPRLTEQYDVVAMDLNGFGYTQRPRRPDAYSYVGQSALVLGVMDALEFDSVHLVGHSYGGGLALHLAVNHPQRLRSLTLVAATPPGGTFPGQSLTALFRPIILWYVETFTLKPGPIRDALRSAVVDDDLITAQVADEYLKRLRVEGFRDAFGGLTTARNRALTSAQLGAIAAPTLILWGEQDAFVPLSTGERLKTQMPRATFKAFPNVGHLSMVESPDAFTDELATFLKSLPGT